MGRKQQGNLLGILTAIFYGLFTLLPDSHSLMVSWPWVFIWQLGWLCPVLWLIGQLWQRQLGWLGNRLDWAIGLLLFAVVVSAGGSEYPMQARWYSWVVFCGVAALYAVSSWLNTPQCRTVLLTAQGYLSLAFIVVSLGLWGQQTWLPELSRLQQLQQVGIRLPYEFSNIQLRNWAPIGHQNYVAGYLVLTLPLLVGLAIVQRGWRRYLWVTATGLGLLTLYTTSSRGGWLALMVVAIGIVAYLLWKSAVPRRGLIYLGVALLGGFISLIVLNNRLKASLAVILSGRGEGEVAFRFITNWTGWHMGNSHLFTGLGLGSVPLVYQSYRPVWAGREAEAVYQLHSTPAHLWAEMGIWSGLVAIVAIGLLIHLSLRYWKISPQTATPPSVLIASILSALLGYSLFCLTDYQLDVVAISGTLILYLAVLAAVFRDPVLLSSTEDVLVEIDAEELLAPEDLLPPPKKLRAARLFKAKLLSSAALLPDLFFPLIGVGMVLAAIVWLVPVHRAWMLSNQGFIALSRNQYSTFSSSLEKAHGLAPWEPYYPYQLGWNLGNRALNITVPGQQQELIKEGAAWLQQGVQVAPDQEFGHSNAAWLWLQTTPDTASRHFAKAAQLVPAKRGAFYGLGLSLLAQGKQSLAVQAMALEILRDPAFLSSPVWQQPQMQPLYQQVTQQLERDLSRSLQTASPTLKPYLHQVRGGLRWWGNDLKGAEADWQSFGSPTSQLLLDLAKGQSVQAKLAPLLPTNRVLAPSDAGLLAIAAWVEPANRESWLRQAWVAKNRTLPSSDILQALVTSMNRSSSLEQWLKQMAPTRRYRRERSGFGVLSRHIDGPIPTDFWTVLENVPMAQFFEQVLPSPIYLPELDRALQPERDRLWQGMAAAEFKSLRTLSNQTSDRQSQP